MDEFELSNEVIRIEPSVARYGPDQSSDWVVTIGVTVAVMAAVTLCHKLGGFINLPSLRLPVLLLLTATLAGCGYESEVVIRKTKGLRSYTSTIAVKSTTPLREAFGVAPDVKKAWLIRAEYPGDEAGMYQALHQLNMLLASKDMATFKSDDERAAFVRKCYEIVGFINVELVDPDKK